MIDKLESKNTLLMLLTKNIPFLRVDWYEINQKIYFEKLIFSELGHEEFTLEKYDEILEKI